MKRLSSVVFLVLLNTLVADCSVCTNKLLSRTKRQTYNYFYASDYEPGGYDNYVNECGYVSNSGGYLDFGNCSDNFVSYYDPLLPTESSIIISDAEFNEVYTIAKQLLDGKCEKEKAFQSLGIGKVNDKCDFLTCSPQSCDSSTNLLEIMYDIFAYRYKKNRFDILRVETINPIPTYICDPNCGDSEGVSELDRILPPFCVLDDSKYLRRLPSPRSLSLLFDQYKYDEQYETLCLNSFGFFLFQTFSHDIQYLQTKSACGDNCVIFNGCTADGSLGLVDNLRTDSVDVMHICAADPYYSTQNISCITSAKLQNYNSDCKIRKRAPVNTVNPKIDLSNIYPKLVVPGPGGSLPKDATSGLPIIDDKRATKTTLSYASHILQALSHDMIASLIKELFPARFTDAEIYDYARILNIYIWQKVLYQYLLPVLLGPAATSFFDIDSTDSCYDVGNVLEVPVETIVVAMRYCHAYIPDSYEFLDENYKVFEKKDLFDVLNPDELAPVLQSVVRGMFSKNVLNDLRDCDGKNQTYTGALRALDIQAARDVCVEPYLMYLKKTYDITVSNDWNAYTTFFAPDKLKVLSLLYHCPQEIELAVAGALENRSQSLWGNLFKLFIGSLFKDFKCSDQNFWSNLDSNSPYKTFLLNFDVQDWIACVAGLTKRPSNLFCPFRTNNLLVPVTCQSKQDMKDFLFSLLNEPDF